MKYAAVSNIGGMTVGNVHTRGVDKESVNNLVCHSFRQSWLSKCDWPTSQRRQSDAANTNSIKPQTLGDRRSAILLTFALLGEAMCSV